MTVVMILTAAVAFVVTALAGKLLIPFLHKLHFGQSIREDGPTWHKSKQGTPTMGGIMFILGSVAAALIGYAVFALTDSGLTDPLEQMQFFGGIVMAMLFGLIGFFDDYIKVVKKRNLGLTAWQKILGQVMVTALYLTALYIAGDRSTIINVPFLGQWDLGFFYYPILGILIIGIVNSVNLTDGIDGLCGSITFIVAVFFMVVSTIAGQYGMKILATALAAACIGFLVYNLHPAKVFMGDTGSLFLGGMVVALGFGMNMEFILFFAGFVYCCESLSVILQVISFKTTGKRIFRMSPIHHHFELGGMSENKIVVLFSSIALIMCIIGVFAFV